MKEIFVCVVRLLITSRRKGILRFETLALVDRVIQLGVSIAHLASVDIKLEALHHGRVVGFPLCQRRDLNRMIDNEGRLDHFLLTELVKEQVDDVTSKMMGFELDVLFLRDGFRLFIGLDGGKINSRVLLHGIDHAQAFERTLHVDLGSLIGDLRASADLVCQVAEHGLGQFHHAVVIGIGLIEFHECEFRIVTRIDTLVPEDAADLVDSFHAADDQALQIEFQGNAQLDIFIERIVVRLKWTRRGTTRIWHKHRCLDFHEAAVIQEPADLADDLRALHEGVAHLGVHDQIQISLTVADVRVLKTMELLRQRNQVLGQECQLVRMDGDLSHLRAEYKSFHADDVSDVHLFEGLVRLLPEAVTRDINLDVSETVLDIAERGLAHHTLAHHAAGDGNLFPFHLLKVLFDVRRVVRLVIRRDDERIVPFCLEIRKLLPADLQQLIHILLRLWLLLLLLVLLCHLCPFLIIIIRQFNCRIPGSIVSPGILSHLSLLPYTRHAFSLGVVILYPSCIPTRICWLSLRQQNVLL